MCRGLLVVAVILLAAACATIPPSRQSVSADLQTQPPIEITGMSAPGFEPPTLVRALQLIYPIEAQERRESGTVSLRAMVGLDGRLTKLEVTGDSQALIAAVTEAARTAEFKPARLAGIPVAVWVTMPVTFTLPPPSIDNFSSGAGFHTGERTLSPPPDSPGRAPERDSGKARR
jgi:TonB family protein